MEDYRLIEKSRLVKDYLRKVRIDINNENCFECGSCTTNFGNYFNFREGIGTIPLIQETRIYDSEIEEIVKSCPVDAISIVESKD